MLTDPLDPVPILLASVSEDVLLLPTRVPVVMRPFASRLTTFERLDVEVEASRRLLELTRELNRSRSERIGELGLLIEVLP